MIIGVQNLSTLVTSEAAYDMTLLVDKQVREHVAPAWGIIPPQVQFVTSARHSPRDAIIGILDDADQAGDLGWHTEGPGADVYGRVFARPVLENGGDALTNMLSVCSVLSHEVIEVLGDAACNGWAQRADGLLIARELCDPVESLSYPVSVASRTTTVRGTVSDFVLPAWFDPDAHPADQFDWLSRLSEPFQVRPDGYVIVMSGGTVTAQWGDRYPAWRKATKAHQAARTARRSGFPHPEGLVAENVPATSALSGSSGIDYQGKPH